MTHSPLEPTSPGLFAGVGFGLRWDHLDELIERLERGERVGIPFLEVSPENYMRRGGYIPESLERIAEHIPLITHGLMMSLGGLDAYDPGYLAELRRFIHRFRSPWHSDHLCFSGVEGRIFHDLLPMPQTRTAARHIVERVREASDRLEIPMAIENISFYAHLGHPDLEETTFIGTILDEADCGLLLDVNNVYVNSRNHGFDARAWLERIDLGRVQQIHVAGHEYREDDGVIIDTHGAQVIEPVYDLLTWTIARTGPVPVILERDNDVPPLAELLAEHQRVTAAYEAGIARWTDKRRPTAPRAPHEVEDDRIRLAAAHRVLDRAVRAADGEALAASLDASSLDPRDRDQLQATDERRVLVYRRLVRGNFEEAISNQLPRTCARMGDAFGRYLARFCEEELPRSQLLRDVAFEFARWASPRWTDDETLPDFLPDLARYELLEFDVYAAVRRSVSAVDGELAADAPVLFDSTCRVGVFDHAVHAVDDEDHETIPKARPHGVFAYRSIESGYRELELTPLASEILIRLLLRQSPFAQAVTAACEAQGVAVDPTVIEGTSRVLADLGERGALLGSRPPAATEPTDGDTTLDLVAPFAHWLAGSAIAF